MITIAALSGSLRQASYNSALLRAAATLGPNGVSIEIASIRDIPLYDGDLELSSGLPAAVSELKAIIANADGLLLATPEYNNSIPGVMKNAIDWLTRPAADIPQVFGGLPVAVIGTSPGGFGTVMAQAAWLPVLRALGTYQWFGRRLLVPRAGQVFDESMSVADADVREQLRAFIAGFCEFVQASVRHSARRA
ncbi:NADPH-dependent FMN reductase [Paraburkholderia domus]|uniref:NADPH-dependent FMN reductase n=1 Tax=Paraburkholderia domus TaxID=2793075 RepID=UPI001B18AB1B|nr:NADPH-dependent FMN reductase [Paraburkholderia domus]CAE6841260.1 NAD(P)H-dependent FMN reductase [Paraburkholderia domus]